MTNKLPCAVVRDLLPSYLEGLTEKETDVLVSEHLKNCKECAECCTRMREPELLEHPEEKQVDYLKKLRRNSCKKVVAAVLCACLILVTGIGAKLFVIGSPLDPESFYYEADLDGDKLMLKMEMTGSALVFGNSRIKNAGSDVIVEGKSVLSSALNRSGSRTEEINLENVQRVFVMGQLVYEDGILVEQRTNQMFQNKTPYVGSMSNVAALARYLVLPNMAFTNQLDTEKEPYGWQLDFEEPLTDDQQKQMRASSALALALVDNLGYVRYTVNGTQSSEEQIFTVTLEEVNHVLPDLVARYNENHQPDWQAKPSVKDYAENAAELQKLVELLKYWTDPI